MVSYKDFKVSTILPVVLLPFNESIDFNSLSTLSSDAILNNSIFSFFNSSIDALSSSKHFGL